MEEQEEIIDLTTNNCENKVCDTDHQNKNKIKYNVWRPNGWRTFLAYLLDNPDNIVVRENKGWKCELVRMNEWTFC